ncbi:hypothetical protein [Aeromicrobium sp. P5_D10]
METVSLTGERLSQRQWLLGGAVALMFVGLVGASQIVSLFAFFVHPGDGFDGRFSILWDIVRQEWGVYLAYGVIGAIAGNLVWRLRAEYAARDLWPVIWRAAVVYVPTSIVVTFVIALGSALIHDRPMFFLGFEVL